MKLKVAYYIAAHHKPYQFDWLFSAIADDANLIIVNVGKKTNDETFRRIASTVSGRKNAVMMPRQRINWGGWSQVAAEMKAIKLALGYRDWDYFIYLSGQDYPIQSTEHIRSRLRDAWPRNFIRVWSFDRVRALEPDDPHLRMRAMLEFFGGVRWLPLPLRLPRLNLDAYYKGSSWHILTRPFCEWLQVDPIVRRLGRYLRFSFCPDETFFQAAIMNSPFRDLRMEDAGRLFFFPGPKILVASDLPAVLESKDLFARKFGAAIDPSVLEVIAKKYGYPAGARP